MMFGSPLGQGVLVLVPERQGLAWSTAMLSW